jgi:hypothetical protein
MLSFHFFRKKFLRVSFNIYPGFNYSLLICLLINGLINKIKISVLSSKNTKKMPVFMHKIA